MGRRGRHACISAFFILVLGRGDRRLVFNGRPGFSSGDLPGFGGRASLRGSQKGFFQGQGFGQHVALGILGLDAVEKFQRALVILEPGRAESGGVKKGVVGKAAVGVAHGHSLVALYGLAGIGLGKGAAGEFLKAFRSAKKRGGAVGPAGIGIIDGAKFRSQLFPGFTQVGTLCVQAQRFNAGLGGIVAFARGRQGRVACVIKENHQQAEGQQEKQRRGETSDAVPGLA